MKKLLNAAFKYSSRKPRTRSPKSIPLYNKTKEDQLKVFTSFGDTYRKSLESVVDKMVNPSQTPLSQVPLSQKSKDEQFRILMNFDENFVEAVKDNNKKIKSMEEDVKPKDYISSNDEMKDIAARDDIKTK